MGPLDRGAIAQSSFGRSKTEPPAKFCCRPLRHRVCLKSARFFSYEIPNPAVGPRLNSDKSRASVISKMILQEHGASMVSWQPTLCLEAVQWIEKFVLFNSLTLSIIWRQSVRIFESLNEFETIEGA